jgi:hypothetical protein
MAFELLDDDANFSPASSGDHPAVSTCDDGP